MDVQLSVEHSMDSLLIVATKAASMTYGIGQLMVIFASPEYYTTIAI